MFVEAKLPTVSNMTEQVEQKNRTNVALKYPIGMMLLFLMTILIPVEFVIKLLVEIFNKNLKSAKDLTLEVPKSHGPAVAGTYPMRLQNKNAEKQLLWLEVKVILTT